MTVEAFAAAHDVSRETLERLERFADCLTRWTRRINLVAPSTVPQIWTRHIADSAQLFGLRPDPCTTWLDLGAGGGLPGLVIAALAADHGGPRVTLVEADRRKAAFLATAAREMDFPAALRPEIRADRVEALSLSLPQPDVISARALAPLTQLLAHAHRLSGPRTVSLFPKGARVDKELTEAAAHWHYRVRRHTSATDPSATILSVTEITPIERPT